MCTMHKRKAPHFGEGLDVGNLSENYALREQFGDFVRFR